MVIKAMVLGKITQRESHDKGEQGQEESSILRCRGRSSKAEGSPAALVVKNLPANAGDVRDAGLIPGSGRSPGGGNGNPHVFLPEKLYGQRSLVGYNPWGCKEPHTTEHACLHYRGNKLPRWADFYAT